MKYVLRGLHTLMVILAITLLTALLTMAVKIVRDRRKADDWIPPLPPTRPKQETITSSHESTTSPSNEPVTSPDGDEEWTRDEIRQLRENISNTTILVLAEMLRERDGAPVNYQELMDRTGRTMPQVRADLSVFSRVVHSIEGHKRWPIDTVEPTDTESNIAYTSPKRYLEWWFEDEHR